MWTQPWSVGTCTSLVMSAQTVGERAWDLLFGRTKAACIVLLLLAQVLMTSTASFTRVSVMRRRHTLLSEDHPYRYRSNTNDYWLLEIKDGYDVINMDLKMMDLASTNTPGNCSDDYVQIYDGNSTEAPLLDTLCDMERTCFWSSNRSMMIHFRSDAIREGKGFKFTYWSSKKTADDCRDKEKGAFKWIGQIIGVVSAAFVFCVFWEFFKKKSNRGTKISNCLRDMSLCCTNCVNVSYQSCANKCSSVVLCFRSIKSRVTTNAHAQNSPTQNNVPRVDSEQTLTRSSSNGRMVFQNGGFAGGENNEHPPLYDESVRNQPPTYTESVSGDQGAVFSTSTSVLSTGYRNNDPPPSYSASQSLGGQHNSSPVPFAMLTPPPSYDYVIANPSTYNSDQ